jgi:hypothetical protein
MSAQLPGTFWRWLFWPSVSKKEKKRKKKEKLHGRLGPPCYLTSQNKRLFLR